MRPALVAFAALGLTVPATALRAHEVRPAYLELRQTGEETFAVTWKVPARGGLRLGIDAGLPGHCKTLASPSTYAADDALVDRLTVSCPGGLAGGTIAIAGLDATWTDVLVRIERANGTTQIARLTPDAPSFVVKEVPGPFEVAKTYLGLGVEHILLGIDHLLFVLALLILVDGRRRLIWTITAFTLAHSLTLAAATLGLVAVPQAPVEASIALSILFVAAEIVHARQGRPGLTARWPWIVALTFGLLHGFGFAGALAEIGLPGEAIPLALLFFNVGVEAGQLVFIAGVGLVVLSARRLLLPRPPWGWRVPAYGIGAVAAFWTIQRVVGFWS